MQSSSVTHVFPLLLPETTNLKAYRGYITVQGHEYQFRIQLPEDGDLKNAAIFGSDALHAILSGHEQTVKLRLEQSPDLPTFLTELKHLLERILRSKKDMVLPPASFYSRLISEINEVGWHSLANINNELTQLQLKQKDAKNREHIINIELSSDYPNTAPKCNCSLPEAVALTWNSKTSNLSDVMTQYSKQALEKYEDFWGVMEDIDKNTCVLEPQHPSMAETMRRIAAVKHVSLQINVDPLAPRSVPECQFLGAETAISPLRDKLNLNLHQWNYKLTLRQNLESVLEIKFPSPSTAKKRRFKHGMCHLLHLSP